MGRMTPHILWKITNVPNHQPDGESGNKHVGRSNQNIQKWFCLAKICGVRFQWRWGNRSNHRKHH